MLTVLWAADGANDSFAPSLPPAVYPVGPDSVIGRVATAAARAGANELLCVTATSDAELLSDELGTERGGVRVQYATPDTPIADISDGSSDGWPTRDGVAALDGATVYDPDGLSRLFDRAPAVTAPADDETADDGPAADGSVEGRAPHAPGSAAYARPPGATPDLPPGATVTDLVRWIREQSEAGAKRQPRQSERCNREHSEAITVRLPVHYDVRRPWELLAANERALAGIDELLAGEIAEDAHLNGPVRVEPDARIRSGVVIEGPAVVRAGASIGPNAYVRGATLVERDARIGHGVEVKNSVLMTGARVPHLSYVGDSIIGPDANLGAGSVVANLRHDDRPVRVTHLGERVSTGRRKFGAVVGERARLGIGTQLNVGVTVAAGAGTDPGETLLRDREAR